MGGRDGEGGGGGRESWPPTSNESDFIASIYKAADFIATCGEEQNDRGRI